MAVNIEKYTTHVHVGNQLWITERKLSLELYEEAVQMYGNLLPDIHYIDWLDRFKTQISDCQSFMLRRLGVYCMIKGEEERAIHFFTEWVSVTPLQEEAYQELLKALVRTGKIAEAKHWYARFEKICKEELNTVPMPETRQIMEGL